MADGTSDERHAVARRFALAAGMNMPEDRLETFAGTLERNHEAVRTVVSRDYWITEPASRFRAPRSE
jgi:hypothetical protein